MVYLDNTEAPKLKVGNNSQLTLQSTPANPAGNSDQLLSKQAAPNPTMAMDPEIAAMAAELGVVADQPPAGFSPEFQPFQLQPGQHSILNYSEEAAETEEEQPEEEEADAAAEEAADEADAAAETAATEPAAQVEAEEVASGGEPLTDNSVSGEQASPPSLLSITDWKSALALLGIETSEIGNIDEFLANRDLSKEDLENGLSWEEAQKLAPNMTRAYFNTLSVQGKGIAGDGMVTLEDAMVFNERVISVLARTLGKPEDIIKQYLAATSFKMVDAEAAARLTGDKFGADEDLYSADGAININTLVTKYVSEPLRNMACAILSRIKGQPILNGEIDGTLSLTVAELEEFYYAMYFLGKLDEPVSLLQSASDIPKLEGDTAEHFLAWLTKGTANEVDEPAETASSEGSSGSSDPERLLSGSAAVMRVQQAAARYMPSEQSAGDIDKALGIYLTALTENSLEFPEQQENGSVVDQQFKLELDAEERSELALDMANLLLANAQMRGENEQAITILENILAGTVEYEGNTIEVTLSTNKAKDYQKQLALAYFSYGQTLANEMGAGPEKMFEALGYLNRAQQLIEENELQVNIRVGATEDGSPITKPAAFAIPQAILRVVYSLAQSAGEEPAEETVEQLQAIRSTLLEGELTEVLQSLIPSWGQNGQGNKGIKSDEACLERFRRYYIAMIDCVVAGQKYNGSIPIFPGLQDTHSPNSNNFGWSGNNPAPTLAQLGAASASTSEGAAQGVAAVGAQPQQTSPLQQALQWGRQQARSVINAHPELSNGQKDAIRNAAVNAARAAFEAGKTEAEIKAAALAAANNALPEADGEEEGPSGW